MPKRQLSLYVYKLNSILKILKLKDDEFEDLRVCPNDGFSFERN